MPAGILIAACVAALTPVAALADPVITGFNNNQVPLNAQLIIYGSGFGSAQGQSYVTIGGRFVPALAWSDVALHVLVNPLAFNQTALALDAVYPVQVIAGGKSSNTQGLTITSQPPPTSTPATVNPQSLSDQPSISGFQAASFHAGGSVTIYGAGFGFTQGSGYVSITVPFLDSKGKPFTQEFAIPVTAWSENAIRTLLFLPNGAQLGKYTVTVHRGNGKTASSSFTVTAPA
jgi:hypothetical protein